MIRERFDLGALGPFWQSTRDWWTQRSFREQMLLGALIATGVLGLLLLALSPIRNARADALDTIRNADLLESMLRGGGAPLARAGQFRRGTPSAIVTNSVSAAQLAVQEVNAEGQGIRVTLADAPFDAVMVWVEDLEATSNLRVRNADIRQQGAPGIVSATFVLSE